ncbi:MAG: DUF4912 domain-containing protein [Nitrospirota bacterium]
MRKQNLAAKTMAELRTMAKKAGVAARSSWKKEDFIKALAAKQSPTRKAAKKAAKPKPAPAKAPKKSPAKKSVKVAAKAPQKKAAKAKAPSKAAPASRDRKKKPAAKQPPKAAPRPALKAKAPAAPKKTERSRPKEKAAPRAARKPAPKAGASSKAPRTGPRAAPATGQWPMEKLTVAELKALAQALKVPLKSGYRKADIIKALRMPKTPAKIPLGKGVSGRKRVSSALKDRKEPAPALRKGKPARAAAAGKAAGMTAPRVLRKPASVKKEPLFRELPKLMEKPPVEAPLPRSGEDKIVTMTVTPRRLYLYWEVSEETVARRPGNLNIKIVEMKKGDAFYLPVDERIGEYFVTVSPEGEYTAEIGVIDRKGEFVTMIPQQKGRPLVATTPPERMAEPPKRRIAVKAAPEPEARPVGGPPEPAAGEREKGPAPVRPRPADEAGEAAGLPAEFFALAVSVSSGAAVARRPRRRPQREEKAARAEGLPEEFFVIPEGISSY